MLERNDTTRPGIGGERDAPDERRALGVLPRPGGLVGAWALDEQAEGRRVRIRRNRYELHVCRRRTFPMSDGDGLDDAYSPGVAGEELARAIPRCPLLAPGNHVPLARGMQADVPHLAEALVLEDSSGFAIPARTRQYDDRLPSQVIPKRRIGLWLLTIGRRYRWSSRTRHRIRGLPGPRHQVPGDRLASVGLDVDVG